MSKKSVKDYKKDYEKGFALINEIIESNDLEIQILCNRLYMLKNYIKNYGVTFPGGKQKFLTYKCIDDMNKIINGYYDTVDKII